MRRFHAGLLVHRGDVVRPSMIRRSRFTTPPPIDARQDVRWRLSRGALSKAIDWELTYSVTRLEGETDATNECDVTVTNEE